MRFVRDILLPPQGGSRNSSKQRPRLPIDFVAGYEFSFARVELRGAAIRFFQPQAIKFLRREVVEAV